MINKDKEYKLDRIEEFLETLPLEWKELKDLVKKIIKKERRIG